MFVGVGVLCWKKKKELKLKYINKIELTVYTDRNNSVKIHSYSKIIVEGNIATCSIDAVCTAVSSEIYWMYISYRWTLDSIFVSIDDDITNATVWLADFAKQNPHRTE